MIRKIYATVIIVTLTLSLPAYGVIENGVIDSGVVENRLADTVDLPSNWRKYQKLSDTLKPITEFPFNKCFQRAGAVHDLPVTLLLAVARAESNFDPTAESGKGALGLMQIRWPATARDLGIKHKRDLYNPCTNVLAGARYLKWLLGRYDGDLHLALAAYNYGPGRVGKQSVPEGARWYSGYIYRHLRYVIGPAALAGKKQAGKEPADKKYAAKKFDYEDEGRLLLMTFHKPHLAKNFIEFLESASPDTRLAWFKAPLGRHQVVVLYRNRQERYRALAAIREVGLQVD